MGRKHWEATEMAFYLAVMILVLAYALAGSYAPLGWHQ